MRTKHLLLGMLSVAMALGALNSARGQDQDKPSVEAGKLFGNTLPSEKAEMTLSSRTSDVVLEIRVKKGDLVKPGDVLAVADIREEQAELKRAKLIANSD